MTEYKIGCATVRIHGKPEQERLKAVTTIFLKKVERSKKQNEKAKAETSHRRR